MRTLSPQSNGKLAIADSILRGDTFTLELGIKVSSTIDVNQTLLVPSFVIEYWSGAGRTGTRSFATVVEQPSCTRKQPLVTTQVTTENTALVPAGTNPYPVQSGEYIQYDFAVTFPVGRMTNASLIVDLNAWFMDSVTITDIQVSSTTRLVSSCGAFNPVVKSLARLGPDPAMPMQIILPLCTVSNLNTRANVTEVC